MVITEMESRSAQGRAQPFLCRGDHGTEYFVKGRHAGLRSLCYERLWARSALALNLPAPAVAICSVPRALISPTSRSDGVELGARPAAGSMFRDDLTGLAATTARLVPEEMSRLVLLFDWWVVNESRAVTDLMASRFQSWLRFGRAFVVRGGIAITPTTKGATK